MKQLSEELQWPAGVGCSHRLGRGGMRGRLPCRCSAAARTRRPPLPLHAWSVLASLPSLPGAWAFDGRKNMRVGPGREGVPALAWARAGASKHASVQPESVPLGAACPCARLSLHGRACRRYAPFAQLVPKNEIQHEVLLPRWGHYTLFRKRGGGGVGLLRGRSLRAGLQEAAPDPPQPRRCPCLGAINCMPTPSCRRRRPPPPPRPRSHQVSVDLEGEGRPRRLLVVIRRVAIIPISSLKVGGGGRGEAGREGLRCLRPRTSLVEDILIRGQAGRPDRSPGS